MAPSSLRCQKVNELMNLKTFECGVCRRSGGYHFTLLSSRLSSQIDRELLENGAVFFMSVSPVGTCSLFVQ